MATNKNFEVKNGLSVGGTERISSAGAFTGSLASTTTATTQSATDNSTKIATTAYTDAAITAVIGGAPGTLDTLNELAAAINDDASYASTLTTALATKLPLAGGAMTGSLLIDAGNNGLDIRLGTDKRVTWSGGIGEIGNTAGFQAVNTAGSALSGFGIRASELKFATGSATRLTIDATGDVTVPGKVLVNTDIRLGSEGVRLSSDGNGEFGIGYGQTATNSRFSVYNNTTVAFRVLPNGNVGIGTTAPVTTLDVGSTNLGLPPTSGTGFTGLARIGYNDRTWTGSEIVFGIINDGNLYYPGYVQMKKPTDQNEERPFLINPQGGNVGIGTTSPTELLEVYSETASTAIEVSAGKASTTTGEAKIVLRSLHSASGTTYSRSEIASVGVAGGDSDLVFRTTSDSSGPQDRMTIDDTGNVGIGTNAPGSRLVVHDNASNNYSTGIQLSQGYNSAYSAINSNFGGSMTINAGQGGGSPELIIQVGGVQKLRLDTNNIYVGGNTDRILKSVYRKNITMNKTFVKLFNVLGNQLSSSFVFSACGTGSGTVVNAKYEILLNHYQDIVIRSLGTYYTEMRIKVVSNGNEDCTVYGAINSANNTSVALEVEPMNNESIEFNPSTVFSTNYHLHNATAGQNITNTGAMAAGVGTTVGYA